MKTQKLTNLRKQIEKIKIELSKIDIMRPGSLSMQYKDPKNKLGGFYQLSYTHEMKSRTEYIKSNYVREITKQIKEFKKFKILIKKWVALSIEYSKLKMAADNKDKPA